MFAISRSSHSYLSRQWPLHVAVVSGAIGFLPWITNFLYDHKLPFIYWLKQPYWSGFGFVFSLLFWTVAIGLLCAGIKSLTAVNERFYLLRKVLSSILIILGIVTLIFGLCTFAESYDDESHTGAHLDSVFYQGHVYHLSIEIKQVVERGETAHVTLTYAVSQCDFSGWFCRVTHADTGTADLYSYGIDYELDRSLAHLEIDSPHSQLLVLFADKSDTRTYPLP
jgi:hypothetical protein